MFANKYFGLKVFLTGHTGFKGSWLTEWLLSLGAEVAGFSNALPSNPNHFEALELEKKITHFIGDIRDFTQLSSAINSFNPDIIFHLAAQPIVKAAYENPLETYTTNTIGTANLLEAVRNSENTKACVIITSDKCYENVEWEFGYRENDRLGGIDPYSASKACAEIICSSYFRTFYKNKNKFIASVRAGNVIGGGDWARDRIVPDCMRAWANNNTALIRNPTATRPWQHVLEPLSGYLWLGIKLLEKDPNVNLESFNFGPAAHVTAPVIELIEKMSLNWKKGLAKIDIVENQLNHSKESGLLKLCCDKALHFLNWKPVLDFEETVNITVDWYNAYYSSPQSIKLFTKHQIDSYQQLAAKRSLIWAQH